MTFRSILSLIVVLLGLALSWAPPAAAQRIALIRDAEIENIIRGYATPLFRAAGLSPSDIAVHLVQDRSINAFVAGGQRLFVHTGLLMRVENPNQLIGVIAHETGHIAGGHLARLQEELRNRAPQMIIEMILAGGPTSLLRYTQTMEYSADQAGLQLLERTQQSPRGMRDFMRYLSQQEAIHVGFNSNPYLRTHPFARERVFILDDAVAKARFADAQDTPANVYLFQRLQAKLFGFLDPAGAISRYPETDRSLPARYGRAIAYYKGGQLQTALASLDILIREQPNDPYFQELRGQMLFESGRVAESIPFYRRAVQLLPSSALLQFDLARIQIESGKPDEARAAAASLERLVQVERSNPEFWRYLATAYDRAGQPAHRDVALAERELALGNGVAARALAERAMRSLPLGTPMYLRAQDVIGAADNARQRR